jgi:hypothetical protein
MRRSSQGSHGTSAKPRKASANGPVEDRRWPADENFPRGSPARVHAGHASFTTPS